MNSQLIYSKSMIPANTNEVDVSQLDPGMYLVIVTSGQYRESQKIIIE